MKVYIERFNSRRTRRESPGPRVLIRSRKSNLQASKSLPQEKVTFACHLLVVSVRKGSLMRSFITFAALTLAMAIPVTAHADTFGFGFTTTTGISAFGFFTTTNAPDANGFYTILSMTAVQNGQAMTLIAPNGYRGNDNLFDPVPTDYPFVFDLHGASYSVPSGSGSVNYNLFVDATLATPVTPRLCSSSTGTGFDCDKDESIPIGTGRVAPTPEPSSLMLLGTGVLSLGAAARRKLRRS